MFQAAGRAAGRAAAASRSGPKPSPPSSPSKARPQSTARGWKAGDPIVFGAPAQASASTSGYRPGDPIRFAPTARAPRSGTSAQDSSKAASTKKGKGKAKADESVKSTTLVDFFRPIQPPSSSRATLGSEYTRPSIASTSSEWPTDEHRWVPPSPSLSSASSASSSTAHFSPNRSYNNVPPCSASPGALVVEDEHISMEVASDGAVDDWGWMGRQTVGVQVGSPKIRSAWPHLPAPPSSFPPSQVSLSQMDVEEGLFDGIDFDDEGMFASSGDESFHSAAEQAPPLEDIIFISSPNITNRKRPPPISPSFQRRIPFAPVVPPKSTSSRLFYTSTATSVVLPSPSSSVSSSSPTDTPSLKSGWFSRPLTTSGKAPAAVAPKPTAVSSSSSSSSQAPATTTAPKKRRSKFAEKRDADQKKQTALRKQYPIEFDYRKFGSRVPEVIYTTEEATVSKILNGMEGPLGFDLEWDPSNRRGIENKTALAQICDEKTVLLVHVSKMKTFSPALKAFIEDASRVKMGVHIKGDADKLRRDFGHLPAGILELSSAARIADPPRWADRASHLIALQVLTGQYLDRYLPKDPAVRCGQWSKDLDDKQKQYAANDVFASLQIFLTLQEQVPSLALLSLATTEYAQGPLKALPGTVPPPRVSHPSPKGSRKREAYDLWTLGREVSSIASKMSETRLIKPASVVGYILGVAATEQEGTVDEQRLWKLWATLKDKNAKGRIREELGPWLAGLEDRMSKQ